MVWWHFPPTPKQLTASAVIFLAGVGLVAVGSHLSFANAAPQRARAAARRRVLDDLLRKKKLDR
ncbi:hypothetical protein ACMD2_06415 [Ananas comosus]|uniref:Uncharacterized protein n=1 Tax=Ananas comosus TaxID=4615 RepID=A0A199VDH4_ANACO|nr:hypothetical protein ACMD2_06415 [Ananas comosus]